MHSNQIRRCWRINHLREEENLGICISGIQMQQFRDYNAVCSGKYWNFLLNELLTPFDRWHKQNASNLRIRIVRFESINQRWDDEFPIDRVALTF